MSRLTWVDMNSLNAIASFLRQNGYDGFAKCLNGIQARATEMIKEEEKRGVANVHISQDGKCDEPKERSLSDTSSSRI